MPNTKVSIEIESHANEALEALGPALERALEKIGLVAEGYAKDICPVDTGRLRNSISHQVDLGSMSVAIGTNVEYGPSIELGHSKKAPNGFLGPAVQNNIEEYRSIVQEELST